MNKLPLVRFNFSEIPINMHCHYPFKDTDVFIMLGEISQMPGHCIVMEFHNKQIHAGYHTDNFTELSDEEC